MNGERSAHALIEWECQQLLNRVALLTDMADWVALADCYAADAVLARPSDPENPIRGKGNILASFKARAPRTTAHLLGNAVFEVIDAHSVKAVSRVFLMSGPDSDGGAPVTSDGAILAGTFNDHLVRINDQWRIAERQGSIEVRHG